MKEGCRPQLRHLLDDVEKKLMAYAERLKGMIERLDGEEEMRNGEELGASSR